uniref:Epidermal growth factor receptor substrate 15-like 1 (Trinotate prediction) n=1 Tax=Henneguya salminicola TaxID=69463 RepID=A0A6G3MDR2_HENSL
MNDASFIWEISEYRKVIWQQAFNSLNPTSNKISGQNAKIHFLNSQLSTNVLSKIWELSDMDKDGSLTLSEFYCACLLIDSCSKGYALPKQLPLELIGLVRATIDHVAQPVAPNYDILSNFFRDNSVQAPTKSHSCSDLVATTSPTNSLSRHEEYIKFFNSLKSFSEDKISGEMAKSVFTRTGLSLQTLAAVWRNSDQDEDGFLSQNEFISAMSQIDSLLAPAFFNPLKLGSSTQLKQVVDQQTNESRNVEDPNKLITHKLNKTLDMIVKDINSANNVLATLKINEKKLLKQKEKVSIDIASLEANHKHTLNSIDEMNKCFQNLKLNPISHPLMPESNAQNQRCNRQSLLEDPCIVPTLTKSYSQDISHLFEVPQQDTITSKYNSSDKFLNNFNDMHIFVPDKQYKNSDNFLSNNGRKSSNITEGLEENVSMKILISPELNRYGGSYTKPIAIAPPPKNPNKGHRISKRPSTSFSNRSGTSSGSKSIEGESQKSSDKSKIGNNKPQSSNSQKIINLFDPHSNQKQFDNNISIQNDRNIQPNSKLNLFGPFCSISPNHSHAIDNFGDISVKNNKKPNPSFKSINASPFLPPQNNIKNPKSVSSEITQSNADTQTDKSVHNIEQIRERACHTKKPKNILKKLFGVSSKCKTKTTKDIPVYSFTNTSHDKPKVPSRPKNETSFFPVSDNNKGQLQTLITTLQNNKLNNSDKNRDFYTV